MKKWIACWLLVPVIGMSQSKTVVNTNRVFPKPDKVAEFEKGLAAHAQKYHTGDWKWRVYEIQSGPDFGGFQLVEGPHTWEQVESRGNLGAEHTADWNKSVAPFITERGESAYGMFREDLSTVQLTDFTNFIAINHVFPKPGYGDKVEENIKRIKKVWEAGGQTVAVYEASSSGAPGYNIVTRYKQGLKERDPNFRKPFKERFIALLGEDAYNNYLESVRSYTDKSWSELLSFRADLSSK